MPAPAWNLWPSFFKTISVAEIAVITSKRSQ